MLYQFKTTATMKPYNNKKWWIDSGIIREITTKADSLTEALRQYQEAVQEHYYITISDNALKTKAPMYHDTKSGEAVQVGYVLTASTDFDNDRRGWVKQYIDLWVTIKTVSNPFEEVTA